MKELLLKPNGFRFTQKGLIFCYQCVEFIKSILPIVSKTLRDAIT
jgi:hypothetical protein